MTLLKDESPIIVMTSDASRQEHSLRATFFEERATATAVIALAASDRASAAIGNRISTLQRDFSREVTTDH